MMTIGLLQERSTTIDISWLIWVILAVFVLLVFLGWWASGRLPKEDETISLEGGGHGGAIAEQESHEEVSVESASLVNQGEQVAEGPQTPAAGADDLVSLEGIGPKTAALLSGMGITTFSALAEADPGRIREALVAAGYGFMDPVGWIEQAKLAATGDEAGLKKLQEALKGGRRSG